MEIIPEENNKLKKRVALKKYIIILTITLIGILGLPFFINYFIIGNNIYSKATNEGWLSFLGSYFGGILGGIGTLLAVLITTKETRKIQNENKDLIFNQIIISKLDKIINQLFEYSTEIIYFVMFITDCEVILDKYYREEVTTKSVINLLDEFKKIQKNLISINEIKNTLLGYKMYANIFYKNVDILEKFQNESDEIISVIEYLINDFFKEIMSDKIMEEARYITMKKELKRYIGLLEDSKKVIAETINIINIQVLLLMKK